MQILCRMMLVAMLTANLYAATISSEVTVAGTTGSGETLYRYTFSVLDVIFSPDTELAIEFDPALYGSLSNAAAPSEFDVLLLQPDNPPGASGFYSALALMSVPAPSGPFTVDFTFFGQGMPGGVLPFSINQLDASGNILDVVDSGLTSNPIPEPATTGLALAGLLSVVVARVAARRGS
jgi:hypothetical protein